MTSRVYRSTSRRSVRRTPETLAASAMLAAAAGIATPITAGAQGDESSQPFVQVDPSTVELGGQIEVTGSCGTEADGQQVPILLGGALEGGQLGEVRTDPITGEFSTTIDIPGPPGATGEGQIIVGCGLGANEDPSAPITLVENGLTPDGDQPATAVGPGDTGELVEFWQDRWNDWAAVAGVDFGALTVDGIFGPRTEQATRIFQEMNDAVPVDGIVNPEDRVALREAIEALQQGAPPDADPGAPPVGRGDSNQLVAWWQDRLNGWLQLSGSSTGPLVVDGFFGPNTEAATIEFQESVEAVEPDGVVHPADRVALRDAIEALEAGPGAPPVGRGDSNQLVAWWQDRLNGWLQLSGSSTGPLVVDGFFGPNTEAATIEFQESVEAVEPDGVVHPADRVALRDAIEALEAGSGVEGDQPVAELSTADRSASVDSTRLALLADVTTATTSNFTRVKFEFGVEGFEPANEVGYEVGYVDQAPSDTTGQQVTVTGEAILQVRITPATGVEVPEPAGDAEPTYTGSERIPVDDSDVVNEIVFVEDQDGTMVWVIGLSGRVPFAVSTTGNPLSLIIDISTTG